MSSREWKRVKLSEACDVITGYPFKSKDFNVNGLGIKLVRGKNVSKRFLRWGDDTRWWNDITPEIEKYLLKESDILVGMDGSLVGKNYVCVKENELPLLLVQRVACIRANQSNNQKFIYYQIANCNFEKYIDSVKTGTSIPHISGSQLLDYKIVLPPLSEQKAIAETLSCLDDMIELNNRTNQILEEIAQTIFKRWFVDFEFPNENGEPYKSSGGEMIDSELGEIPNQWVFGTINDISKEIICGKTPSTKDVDNYGDDMPFITIPDMHDKVFVIKTERYLSRKGVRTQPGKVLPRHSVCVSCIATPGLVCLTSEESQTNQQINSIICNDDISCFYTFFLLRSLSEKIKILGSSGSTTSNLNKTQFSKIEIIISPRKIQNQFHNIVEPLFSTIKHNAIESCQLDKLKASLLPKLMSGEIRVPIEEVV